MAPVAAAAAQPEDLRKQNRCRKTAVDVKVLHDFAAAAELKFNFQFKNAKKQRKDRLTLSIE